MKRTWQLTQGDVFAHPEFASLAMLDSVLQSAVLAITTANPELVLEQETAWRERPYAGLIHCSNDLIEQLKDLRKSLKHYRKEVAAYEQEEPIPF